MNNRALSVSTSFVSFGVFCIVLMAGYFFFSIIETPGNHILYYLGVGWGLLLAFMLSVGGAYSMLDVLRRRSVTRKKDQKVMQERLFTVVISAAVGGFSAAVGWAYVTPTPNILWVFWGIAAAFILNAGWVIYQIATEKMRY